MTALRTILGVLGPLMEALYLSCTISQVLSQACMHTQ